ncbi:PKD domain-containing protein [Barnesiella propionica]|uniref:PKD domain-containing protein n=1 Tax=Barnesiella propionica TaxID=2981781 RepID=UPI0011CA3819|nr:PKD domain-containing protein [Barnesiella propionica]MCU6769736.1 PKD domain-containing protein [Barnesiella propionica]
MKLFRYILLTTVLLLSLSACVENDPTYHKFPGDKVTFTYAVDGKYELDFLVGSTIKFTNTSEVSGSCHWDFGDGEPVEEGQATAQNPYHKYTKAGKFTVTLTIEGEGSVSMPIMINEIIPSLTVDPMEDVCVINETPITISVELRNPNESDVPEYTWVLPEGTTLLDKPIEGNIYVGDNPGRMTFKNIGSQKVTLQTVLGGKKLQDATVNVQVGTPTPAKTIYYAAKAGNIMAYKLVTNVPEGTKVLPFDLGVKSGSHPLNMQFYETSQTLFVFDCGAQFTYTGTPDNAGDGKISALSADASTVETVLANGGNAFNDPFYGYVDDTYIYFADRNTGIRRVGIDTRNSSLSADEPYFVQNNTLAYYGKPWQYGAMNACFTRVGDTWYWAKTYGGGGIFRFKDSDINGTTVPAKIIFPNAFVKSFVVDTENRMLYAIIREKGFYAVPLDDIEANDKAEKDTEEGSYLKVSFSSDSEGSSGEYIDVCQMIVDNTDGSVYFGYRKADADKEPTGLKRWNPANPTKLETIVDGVRIYGIAINNTETKLF